MKPSKKPRGPDPIPPEPPSEALGGTDGEGERPFEQGLEGDEGSGGGARLYIQAGSRMKDLPQDDDETPF